jgi:HlyD family secretion protein
MSDTQSKPESISAVLNSRKSSPGRRWLKWGILVVVLAAMGGGGYAWWNASRSKGPVFKTTKVERGELVVTVTATGNLQPTKTVDVGSEISGTVAELFADYNDTVKKGQLLVRLDTTKLSLQTERSRASLLANQARVAQARATLGEARDSLNRLEEVFRLSGGKVPSATELDAARAKLARGEADLAAAEAAAAESALAVKSGENDLAKATIRSPIDGTVLKRSVELGQTVAASLQAPVLFSLAQDLHEMELVVAIAEADVGKVKEGMDARFTVDAYPDKKFPARIKQVRYGSVTVDNVVSYQALLSVKNSDLSLRPGMTATADIEVARHENVLRVANAALRFRPPVQEQAQQSSRGGSVVNALVPRPPQQRPSGQAGQRGAGEGGRNRVRLWVPDGTSYKPVPVRTLISDGRFTEIETDQLAEGDEVITDMEIKK